MSEMNSKQAAIVIIDDEPQVCRGYKDELFWNYNFKNIKLFTDPREALGHIKEHKEDIDIILLDLQMPHIDGIEMITKIKNIDKQVKIIVISAFSHLDKVKNALNVIKDEDIIKSIQNKPVHGFAKIAELIEQAYQQKRDS